MATKTAELRIGKHVTDRKARAAIEKTVAAHRELVEREAAEHLAKQKARNDDVAAIFKPFADLIKTDPAAERAIKKLGSVLGKERLHWSEKMQRSPSSKARPFVVCDPVNLTIRRPPYDFGMLQGNYSQGSADPENGAISVLGDSGSVGGMSGPVHASAAIGFIWTPPTPDDLAVRFCPQVQYEWSYNDGAYGAGSSVSTQGIIAIVLMQKDRSGCQNMQLFYDSGSTAHGGSNSQQGMIAGGVNDFGASIGTLNFEGIPIHVLIEVLVQCDHSTVIGATRAAGCAMASVSSVNIYFEQFPTRP
jgi:hypothetical protein